VLIERQSVEGELIIEAEMGIQEFVLVDLGFHVPER
jgi:hypothetical protein